MQTETEELKEVDALKILIEELERKNADLVRRLAERSPGV